MKRFTSFMLMLFCLTIFAVGCGDGKSTEPGPNLEEEATLEADMAEQAKMAAEDGGGAPDGLDPAAP